ncbi:hypothetical protein BD413DRAFT_611998 [Trametes elegans]|nr:hypothetical protein BD413DRAFT_611998 [Trametes elegans]
MSYINKYAPPAARGRTLPESQLYGPEPYDINWAYTVHEDALHNERTKLIPFIPKVHAGPYWMQVGHRPETFPHYPAIFSTLPEFLSWIEVKIRRDSHSIFFAVIDRTRLDPEHPEWGGSFAGVVGLCRTDARNLATEVANVVVFPDFRGTHVAKDLVGLLLRYTLQLLATLPPGIGYRRLVWTAHPQNIASIKLATRLGLKCEGMMRWTWVLPD